MRAMKVVVFRNRVREEMMQEYGERAGRIYELALEMPGLVSSKDFVAEDGERLTVIEFRSTEELEAWRVHTEHRAAQDEGRQRFFDEYSLQVCDLVRESRWTRPGYEPGKR
jgi:heme-degrading monooxygenase HmoA